VDSGGSGNSASTTPVTGSAGSGNSSLLVGTRRPTIDETNNPKQKSITNSDGEQEPANGEDGLPTSAASSHHTLPIKSSKLHSSRHKLKALGKEDPVAKLQQQREPQPQQDEDGEGSPRHTGSPRTAASPRSVDKIHRSRSAKSTTSPLRRSGSYKDENVEGDGGGSNAGTPRENENATDAQTPSPTATTTTTTSTAAVAATSSPRPVHKSKTASARYNSARDISKVDLNNLIDNDNNSDSHKPIARTHSKRTRGAGAVSSPTQTQ